MGTGAFTLRCCGCGGLWMVCVGIAVQGQQKVNMYRLHIDIPLNLDEGSACALTHQVMADMLQACTARLREAGIGVLNYRLGHDEDRQKSNYLLKTASGHVVNKKSRISITEKDCENAE